MLVLFTRNSLPSTQGASGSGLESPCNSPSTTSAMNGLLSFVLWTFVETAMGIVQEHLILLTERNVMKNMFAHPSSAAITSFILCLPIGLTFLAFMFDIGPLVKTLNNLFTIEGQQGDINTLGRVVIYGGLLLLPVAFVLNLRPMLKREGPDQKRRLYALNLTVCAVLLLLITFTWGGLVLEEIYCLRGIRCD